MLKYKIQAITMDVFFEKNDWISFHVHESIN